MKNPECFEGRWHKTKNQILATAGLAAVPALLALTHATEIGVKYSRSRKDAELLLLDRGRIYGSIRPKNGFETIINKGGSLVGVFSGTQVIIKDFEPDENHEGRVVALIGGEIYARVKKGKIVTWMKGGKKVIFVPGEKIILDKTGLEVTNKY